MITGLDSWVGELVAVANPFSVNWIKLEPISYLLSCTIKEFHLAIFDVEFLQFRFGFNIFLGKGDRETRYNIIIAHD